MVQVVRLEMAVKRAQRERGNLSNCLAIWILGDVDYLVSLILIVGQIVSIPGIDSGQPVDDAWVLHAHGSPGLKVYFSGPENLLQQLMELKPSYHCTHPQS